MSQLLTSAGGRSSSPLCTLLTDSQLVSLDKVSRETGVGGGGSDRVPNLDYLTVLGELQNAALYHCKKRQSIQLTGASSVANIQTSPGFQQLTIHHTLAEWWNAGPGAICLTSSRIPSDKNVADVTDVGGSAGEFDTS